MEPTLTGTVERQRRLEMVADRIEAVCASRKIGARSPRCAERGNRVMLAFALAPDDDMRTVGDEIKLSLACIGVPATVHRDNVIVTVEP